MFSKILIANRGEVAVRVIRACREMGIKTVAVYSKADTYALHTAMADQAVCIGEASSSDSYLNAERIVAAAPSIPVMVFFRRTRPLPACAKSTVSSLSGPVRILWISSATRSRQSA